jgi:uncharacterized protein YozE (UPF0346 family)
MYLSEYVLAQQDREDSVGDLARDAAADEGWPVTRLFTELSFHLRKRGATEEAFGALAEAWREYRRKEYESG